MAQKKKRKRSDSDKDDTFYYRYSSVSSSSEQPATTADPTRNPAVQEAQLPRNRRSTSQTSTTP
ncbi:hypothetical protein Dsin_007245 [Dipteronia sinensis]|uniref:Uncharacterized protein n=1 Tax=Dipteronia sinensis TaxID=43782 RepID=A0AAE0AZS6_9ROSI|nr:hypothetical protein Dsin_007245 [Dipteronia sinensis]